jgi:hypothetical protein
MAVQSYERRSTQEREQGLSMWLKHGHLQTWIIFVTSEDHKNNLCLQIVNTLSTLNPFNITTTWMLMSENILWMLKLQHLINIIQHKTGLITSHTVQFHIKLL